jgi:hypothetical protein
MERLNQLDEYSHRGVDSTLNLAMEMFNLATNSPSWIIACTKVERVVRFGLRLLTTSGNSIGCQYQSSRGKHYLSRFKWWAIQIYFPSRKDTIDFYNRLPSRCRCQIGIANSSGILLSIVLEGNSHHRSRLKCGIHFQGVELRRELQTDSGFTRLLHGYLWVFGPSLQLDLIPSRIDTAIDSLH